MLGGGGGGGGGGERREIGVINPKNQNPEKKKQTKKTKKKKKKRKTQRGIHSLETCPQRAVVRGHEEGRKKSQEDKRMLKKGQESIEEATVVYLKGESGGRR